MRTGTLAAVLVVPHDVTALSVRATVGGVLPPGLAPDAPQPTTAAATAAMPISAQHTRERRRPPGVSFRHHSSCRSPSNLPKPALRYDVGRGWIVAAAARPHGCRPRPVPRRRGDKHPGTGAETQDGCETSGTVR